ncbi:MAG: hypothetical protein ABEJ23_05945 [Haloarculaceae archaeon]
MPSSARDLATTGAVLFGALLLFGPATYVVVAGAVATLAGVAGLAPLAGRPALLRSLTALLVALVVATEAAAVRLHGAAALRRGSQARQLGRHLALAVAVLASLVVAVDVLVRIGRWSLGTGRIAVLALSVVVAVAVAWTVGRAAVAFYRGVRTARH